MTSVPNPISCIVIDDNEFDRDAIVQKVKQHSQLEIAGIYDNALDAFSTLEHQDKKLLLLLDIDMPGISGIQLLQNLQANHIGIFITSHPEYAIDAYETQALDYLLKPIITERFNRSIQRVMEFFDIQNKARLYDIYFGGDTLLIKEGYDSIRIKISDIIYLEALKDYTKIITADKTYITLANLKTFFEKLPQKLFMRVHRSYAVSVTHIKRLEQNELWVNNINIPVGKTYKQEVNKQIMLNAKA